MQRRIRKLITSILIACSSFVPLAHAEPLLERVNDLDVKQIRCLADNIYHEAKGEPHDGKLAVALVTMNRTAAKGFPETVCGVVYEKTRGFCQFSWVCRNLFPNRDSDLYRQIYLLAENTYLNYSKSVTDITKRSLYFHAVHVNPGWNLRRTVTIGRHVFYGKRERDVQERGENVGSRP